MGLQWEKRIIQEYQSEITLDDLAGRKNWINYLRFTLDPEADGGNCLLFIGEAHTGKKTLLRAAAGRLHVGSVPWSLHRHLLFLFLLHG